MRFWMSFVGVVMIVGMIGCKTAGPQSFEDTKALIEQARQIAEEQGISWHAELEFNGSPNVYQRTEFGLDSGVKAKVFFQGNAQTEASEDVVNVPTSDPQ